MSLEEAPFVVVICHGCYHTPEPYHLFITALKAQGIEAYCPQLPSSDLRKMDIGDVANPDYNRDPPPNGYPQPADDAVVLNELLSQLILESGKHVVLVGHSAGGFTATLVAIPELQVKNCKVKGASGGIIGIFYYAAFLVPVGESVDSFFRPKDDSEFTVPPYCHFHKFGFKGLASIDDGAKYFFNGLDDAAAKRYEATLTASPVFTTVLHNDAYTALPCAYLVTEIDLAIPSTYQEMMVSMQSQRPGVNMSVFKCPAGHSPHLTWTEGLVEKVREFGWRIGSNSLRNL